MAKEYISIHVLREEGDTCTTRTATGAETFLSTSSARRATLRKVIFSVSVTFLSTSSARRATATPAHTSTS